MTKGLFFRLLFCIFLLGSVLYIFIEKQNELTELRLEIPQLANALEEIKQENIRLQYEIEQLENPERLMELAQKPEYCHLKQPRLDEIIYFNQSAR